MSHFTFQYPLFFLLLFLIICIYRCPASLKKIIFPHLNLFVRKTSWFNRERLFYSLILTLMVTAMASPISYDQKVSQERKGRDLVFVIDTSGSMAESGYDAEQKELSKFDIIKAVLRRFVQERFDDNIGVTVFGTFAFSSVPLTYDMKAVSFLLDYIDVGIAGDNTAIGEGISAATRLLEKGNAKSKVILLMTDGHQNSGAISAKDAVSLALHDGIKIYTIGIGKAGSYDKELLQRIANDTNAKMFEASDASTLQSIYDELNILEPSKIHSEHYLNKQLYFALPLLLATLLLLYLLRKRRF